jgi:HK97 family phage major capsid protein
VDELHRQCLECSIELIEDSSNVAQLVQQTIMRAMGQKLDAAILEGSGSGAEPTGILNTSGINTVTSVGTPTNYDEMTTAVKELLVDNYSGDISGLAWIAHPRDYATYDGLVDTTNQSLRPTQWVGDLKRFSTTELPINGGAGTNESSMIVGDFTQCVLGMRTNGVQIRVSADGIANDGSSDINATSQLLRWIIAFVRADVAVLRPDHFTALTGVLA